MATTTTHAEEKYEEDLIPEYGSLRDELEKFFAQVGERIPKEKLDLMERDMDSWRHSKILDDIPKSGEVLPDFALPDGNGNIVSSVDLRAQGPVVVLFFRGNWCGYCNRTLKMLRKYTPHLKARGASVVAISGQNMEESKKTVAMGGLNFPVLSDLGHEYAQQLGIAFVLAQRIKKIYEEFGVKFLEFNDEDTGILPIPATFVIESDGRVVYSHVEVDYKKRAEPVDILNSLPPLKAARRQSLSDRMEMEYAKMQDSWAESRHQTFMGAIRAAQMKGVEENALQMGEKAPDFRLTDKHGVTFESRKIRKQGPLVVMFTLGSKSSLCKIQVDLMQKNLSKFQAKGANVVVVCPPQQSGSMFINAVNTSTIPTLYDTEDHTVAKQFGLMYELPGHLAGMNHEELVELPMVATYVIAPSGKIIYSFVNVDPTKRPEPAKVLHGIPTEFQSRPSLKWGPFSLLANRRLSPSVRVR